MSKTATIIILIILVMVVGFVMYYINQANKEVAQTIKSKEEPSLFDVSFGLS